jgi:hypothetical protein
MMTLICGSPTDLHGGFERAQEADGRRAMIGPQVSVFA